MTIISKFHKIFPRSRAREFISSWSVPASYVISWFPVALLGIYLKQIELTKQYLPISRTIGRSVGDDISLLEKLTFFRLDILFCLFAIPLFLVVALRFVAPKFRSIVIILLSVPFALLFFTNLQSLGNIGRYMSFDLIKDAVNWSLAHPWFIGQYVEADALAKLAIVIIAIIIGALPWGTKSSRYTFLSVMYLRKLKSIAFAAVIVMSLLASGLAYLPDFPSLPQHKRTAIQTALVSLLQIGEGASSELDGMVPEGVVSLYREFTGSPEPRKNPAFAGSEAGSDMIIFVLETAANRTVDLTGSMRGLPNLRSLKNRAFVAERHYSTYPYTTPALYSIFTSYYPPAGRMGLTLQNRSKSLETGVFENLRSQGYATSTHSPFILTFEADDRMFDLFGVDRQFIAERDTPMLKSVESQVRYEMAQVSPRLKAIPEDRAQLERVLTHDLAALESLKREITKNKKDGKRFVTAFLPQIGHGPWFDVEDNGDDYLARGKAISKLQDRWLGQILQLLRENSWLENTVIVLTGDHGIRIKKEDPKFVPGKISDYSFHVPLLIFAPNALNSEKRIPWLTSHIDIVPSVLDLLGIENGRVLEQGTAIWDSRLAGRKTFFLAKGYFGADGFHQNGRFYMKNHFFGTVYKSDKLKFSLEDIVLPADPVYSMVESSIDSMRNIQERWTTLSD